MSLCRHRKPRVVFAVSKIMPTNRKKKKRNGRHHLF
jgi:hypothetical protein